MIIWRECTVLQVGHELLSALTQVVFFITYINLLISDMQMRGRKTMMTLIWCVPPDIY